MRWSIRRLGRGGPGAVVARVEAESGRGALTVLDPECREILEDLFLYDQTELAGREASEALAKTTVRVLHPWQDETLRHVRGKLPRHGFVAEDADGP